MQANSKEKAQTVAPLAGAWIETGEAPGGLVGYIVAPLAGAWIETVESRCMHGPDQSRTPRGCVD